MTGKPPTLNPALRPFWRTKADLRILKGGRVSTKTWDAAGFAIFLACNYRVKFLCMRQFQNKIAESVYAVLLVQIERFSLFNEFEILKTVIRHRRTGAEFHFYGINRDIAEIKGFEGADIGWIEEGEGLTKEQWVHIEPTLRREGAECWIIYNPRLTGDFVETFKHDPENRILVRHINYDENPFISDTSLRKIERMKKVDYDDYLHYYEGVAWKDDDNVVIKRTHIEAAIDAHIKLKIPIAGNKRIGFDVADDGKDLNAQILSHGIVSLWGENWKGGEDRLMQSCKRVYNTALKHGAHVDYDSIGVGAMAGSKFAEINEERKEENLIGQITYSKFVAGAKVVNPKGLYIDTPEEQVTNKDFFSNLKAQAWWLIADRFRNTYAALEYGEKFEDDELISISSDMPNLEALITQLCTPRRHFDKFGRVKVESKDELAAREIDSPNDADAFIMANGPQETDTFNDLLRLAIGAN